MNSTKYADDMLSSLKCTELRELCKENRLKPKGRGRKHELIETLKSIPALVEDDDYVLKESIHQKQDRPVFGDISIITVNSPPCSSVRGRKRCVGQENTAGDAVVENEQTVYLTPAGMASEQKSDAIKVTDQDVLTKASTDIKAKENELQTLIGQFEEPFKSIISLMEKRKAELEKSKCTGEKYLQEILEQKVAEKELHLSHKYENEMKSLRADFSIQLKQKEILLSEKGSQVKKMETEIGSRQREMEVLVGEQEQLKLTVEELKTNLKLKENELLAQAGLMKALESDVRQKIIEGIEDEFTCVICQELFISAVTLPCGHSFCEMCLMTWFRTKKSCPVCRHDVKQKSLYSVVLDSAVEKMVESMDASSKHRRTALLRERNEAKRRNDAAEDPQGIKKMIYRIGEENSNIIASHIPGPVRQTVADNRRRSRSISPARSAANRPPANNYNNNNNNNSNNVYQANRLQNALNSVLNNYQQTNYSYPRMHGGLRCWNCGGNHHVRNCPRR